jgi:hypothetical protein
MIHFSDLLTLFPLGRSAGVCAVGSLCQTILIHYCSGLFGDGAFKELPAVMKRTHARTRERPIQADWRAASRFEARQPACRRRHAGCLIRLPRSLSLSSAAARAGRSLRAPLRIHNTHNIQNRPDTWSSSTHAALKAEKCFSSSLMFPSRQQTYPAKLTLSTAGSFIDILKPRNLTWTTWFWIVTRGFLSTGLICRFLQ